MTCADSVLRVGGSLIVSTRVVPRRSVSSSEGMATRFRDEACGRETSPFIRGIVSRRGVAPSAPDAHERGPDC